MLKNFNFFLDDLNYKVFFQGSGIRLNKLNFLFLFGGVLSEKDRRFVKFQRFFTFFSGGKLLSITYFCSKNKQFSESFMVLRSSIFCLKKMVMFAANFNYFVPASYTKLNRFFIIDSLYPFFKRFGNLNVSLYIEPVWSKSYVDAVNLNSIIAKTLLK